MPNHRPNSVGDVAGRLRRLAAHRLAARRAVSGATTGEPLPSAGEAPSGQPRTTVEATIRPIGDGRYRGLAWAPGEPHRLLSDDGVTPAPDRAARRRSLLYFA